MMTTMKITPSMITGGRQQQPLLSQPFTATRTSSRSFSSISCSLQTQKLMMTDSSDGLTRRFGLGAAGISWAAFLVSQKKTKDTRDMEKGGVVVLPNGIRYYDMEIGTGECPRAGDLVVMNLKGNVVGGKDGVTIVDTFEGTKKKKPMAMVVMGSRPYSKGMCEGIEHVVRSMKAGGVRRVIVPPSFGFGVHGADFGSLNIPPSSTLEYIVEVHSVSTPAA